MEDKVIDNEFLLQDRLQKIQQILNRYGAEHFYISFSGGKDSTVLHYLIDEALPNNKIPRVFCNTGMEYTGIVNFVKELAEQDSRFKILNNETPIQTTLREQGYPFKSKDFSAVYKDYKKKGFELKHIKDYYEGNYSSRARRCPEKLKYMFDEDWDRLKISDACCEVFKEKPLEQWKKKNHKRYSIVGLMPSEGGRRESAKCLAYRNKLLKSFHPLVPVTKEWEDWYIESRGIKLCELYYPPYNFERTGCKGCPFNLNLQKDLDVMKELLPNEYKQCEILWKPVYEEYRRIGYRLRGVSEDPETWI